MKQRTKWFALFIALAELAVALPLVEVWLLPFHYWSEGGSTGDLPVMAFVICIAFLVLPLIAVYGVLKSKLVGYIAMGLFPIVAGLGLGVTALPFVKYLYPFAPQFTSVLIISINASVVMLTIAIYCICELRREST